MRTTPTVIPDVLIFEPQVFADDRGHFFESFRDVAFARSVESAGMSAPKAFPQDNQSRSLRGVLRGMHYQIRQPQGKLVRVVSGEIFDVAVDVRRSSPTFGKWVGTILSADNRRQLWIPPGFAHGFLTLSDVADVVYKATDYYAPTHERTLLWSDPKVAIAWPLTCPPVLAARDAAGTCLAEADLFE